MSEHARLSPSGSDRWMRCSASVNLSHGYPDSSSEAAEEGTRAHKAFEEALKSWIMFGDEAVDMTLCDDQEMFDHVQGCVDHVIEIYLLMLEADPDAKMLVEQRLDLHYMTNRDDLWGRGDVILSSKLELHCMDLKYGAGIFVQADSSQNKIYLLGAMCPHLKAHRGLYTWKDVFSVILQPRYPDADGKIFREKRYTPDELMQWKDDVLLPAAEATDNPGEPVAGVKQCQFCVVKADCPAVANKARDLCSIFEAVASTPRIRSETSSSPA